MSLRNFGRNNSTQAKAKASLLKLRVKKGAQQESSPEKGP
jgi:hypothetical protein